MNWTTLAIIAQSVFTLWFAITHWVPLPRLNNLDEEAFPNERRTNLILHLFQLASILGFAYHLFWIMLLGTLFWSVSLVGHILSWWMPYFFGWPKAFLENAEIDNAKTYYFLPLRKNYPVPDFNHCIIGLLAIFAFFTSWMAYVNF